MLYTGVMMPELRLMIESLLVSHAKEHGDQSLGWIALDVAQWMTDLASAELAGTLSEAELQKIHALSQVIATVTEVINPKPDPSNV